MSKASIRALQRQARLNILARKATALGWTNVKIVGSGPTAYVRGKKPGARYLSRVPRNIDDYRGTAENRDTYYD